HPTIITTAVLSGCGLTEGSCKSLTSVLQTENSLRELEMNKNDLQISGVEQLCAGLKSSHGKLEILRLSGCGLTEGTCKFLTSVLQTENSLRELEMNNNDLQNSGVKQLCAGLKISVTIFNSCKSLTSVLQTENSLRELKINNNDLQNSGVEQLCAGLKSSNCKLEILRLSGCGLNEESCKSLTSVLQTENSLRELKINNNDLQNSGVEQLCAGLKISVTIFEFLQTENSLRELEMNNNDLQNSGVEQLCAGLKSSHCKLEILSASHSLSLSTCFPSFCRLSGCLVTEEGCSSLASALRSNPSHLEELDLTYNHPGESGVKLLSARLEDPHCRLDTLRYGTLVCEVLTDVGCVL
uniref:Uncharacterized protein n=1 Tax=Electrophorus electricus TaxID=8005 RepID=A0AAY5EYV7_ELEEL